ncbi:helix-turn-helix domain-containing protein [Amycolatopsis sp. NPDC049691]|uniref:TetR/AcrR family transcriptional regulator n=1 Tax=Amycolatopsis sp. NPDC049691 TaxID=3155155 RepID=UPI00341F43B0
MTSPARRLRSDALRNRERVLAAAEDEFAEQGIDASVSDIARRAGVAKGTVFSHFATKEELIVAVVANHLAELKEVAERLGKAPDPGAALLEFLTVAGDRRRQRDLTFLMSASADDATVTEIRNSLHADVSALVDRARAGGAIRHDVTGTDVFLLICAPVHVVENLPGAPADLWLRYLAIIFDGLRPAGASPLPRPAPDWT